MKLNREEDAVLNQVKRLHMIGIGGSGMCPIAEILHAKGYQLTGSDNNEGDPLKRIRALGIPVTMGHKAENVHGAELVVYSAAIHADNPEIVEANRLQIPVIERSHILGMITRKFDKVIGVCGTHGKTTVSSMITQILLQNNYHPTAVIGGRLPLINANGLAGDSEYMVCESCEFVDTFLKLYPDVALILNIDEDHLDYFKTLENLKHSFTKFASNASKCVVYNGDDENTLDAVKDISGKDMITFGWGESNDYYPVITKTEGLKTWFTVYYKGDKLLNAQIRVPGRHNVLNATAATAAARYLGISCECIAKGLAEFAGAIRRFEHIADVAGVTIVDDYAHHPAEIAATLKTARGLGFKRLIAVHQPFTYSRTAMLMDDFVSALSIADKAVVTDIMGSREKNTFGVSAGQLVEKLENGVLTPSFNDCVEYLKKELKPGDMVITLGCGDIYKVAKRLACELKNSEPEGKAGL